MASGSRPPAPPYGDSSTNADEDGIEAAVKTTVEGDAPPTNENEEGAKESLLLVAESGMLKHDPSRSIAVAFLTRLAPLVESRGKLEPLSSSNRAALSEAVLNVKSEHERLSTSGQLTPEHQQTVKNLHAWNWWKHYPSWLSSEGLSEEVRAELESTQEKKVTTPTPAAPTMAGDSLSRPPDNDASLAANADATPAAGYPSSSTGGVPEKADGVRPSSADGPYQVRMMRAADLHRHPLNAKIFGDPRREPRYQDLLESVRSKGIQEPLITTFKDGVWVVLSGNTRLDIATDLDMEEVPTRVHPGFASEREEIEYLVAANVERRQLSEEQIGRAYHQLVSLSLEEGGVKRKVGRPKKDGEAAVGVEKGGRTRDDAAKRLGISREKAMALARIFADESTPEQVREAVRKGTLTPPKAAKLLRDEAERQGGTLADPEPVLKVMVAPKCVPEFEDRLMTMLKSLCRLVEQATHGEVERLGALLTSIMPAIKQYTDADKNP